MKLSELIATLQTTLDEKGDTEEIALCFVVEERPARRLDVFGAVTVLHDTAEYPNGMAYLVADCNVQPANLTEGEPSNANSGTWAVRVSNDTKTKAEIERGMELLALCQQLQSEKDGIDRPDPGVYDKTKTLDQFAMDISQAMTNMSALYMLFPMVEKLAEMGRKLEAEGKISVDYGDGYHEGALKFVLAEHGLV